MPQRKQSYAFLIAISDTKLEHPLLRTIEEHISQSFLIGNRHIHT